MDLVFQEGRDARVLIATDNSKLSNQLANKGTTSIFVQIATLRCCLRQKSQPDLDRVHKIVLAEFRKGELGKTSFGRPPKIATQA